MENLKETMQNKKRKLMPPLLPYITKDIIVEILSRLPGKSLLLFKRVCKYWFDLISEPSFVKLHLTNHAENNPLLFLTGQNPDNKDLLFHTLVVDDDVTTNGGEPCRVEVEVPAPLKSRNNEGLRIVGSCNGVICMAITSDPAAKLLFLWNPCTNEFKELPAIEKLQSTEILTSNSYGFGYDRSTDDYKVTTSTCVIDHLLHEFRIVGEVYTLSTNSWKPIVNINEDKTYRFCCFLEDTHTGWYLDGAIYWIVYRQSKLSHNMDLDVIILSFDVEREVCREIPVPADQSNKNWEDLADFEGRLCLVNVTKEKFQEVWMMNDDAGDGEPTWSKYFTIIKPIIACPYDDKYFQQLGMAKGNETLMIMGDTGLVWYDKKLDKTRHIANISGNEYKWEQVETYVNSLVSLKL